MDNIIFYIVLGYLANIVISGIINIFNTTRIPNNGWDFIKLTFLPYVLFHLKDISIYNE